MTVHNLPLAQADRDEAIDRVQRRVVYERVYEIASQYAMTRRRFTSEDVRDEVERKDAEAALAITKEPRVMGAVMRELSRERIAQPTNEMEITGRRMNHNRPQRIWQGRLR